jgi:pimeloyl-ACP methyl ester carboxylesterase
MGNVTAFIRRQYVSKPTDSGLWLVAGGPGDSTITLAGPMCDYFIGSNNSFTCYTQDARGTGLSSYMSCGKNQPPGPFNPYNSTQITAFANCFNMIKSQYGPLLQYYSTYNAAKDLLGGIQAINPSLVHIYAMSYGTYAINTYLLLPGARADVIVLDGPVPTNRWPLENNAGKYFYYKRIIQLFFSIFRGFKSGLLKSLKTLLLDAFQTHPCVPIVCH